MEKLICMTCKQSLLSYRIAPNENRTRVGSIQQHFRFHWTAKRDGSLRNEPKSDPILGKHSICLQALFEKISFGNDALLQERGN